VEEVDLIHDVVQEPARLQPQNQRRWSEAFVSSQRGVSLSVQKTDNIQNDEKGI